MAKFSSISLEKLNTANPKLRELFLEVVKGIDCSVLCGFRTEAEQNDAFIRGFSKVQYPNSKHNNYPSDAVDVVPFPLDWNEPKSFYFLAGYVKATADRLGIKVRWGGDFNQDGKLTNDAFVDLPHWELVKEA